MMEQWDKYLEDFSTSGTWLPHRYTTANAAPSLALTCYASGIPVWPQLTEDSAAFSFMLSRYRDINIANRI